ncbi:MAG: DUF4178 domain-containing protein [Parcubacteria group bacterium]|nr:DUF4178 domain-containing protein [Parcubacteria group bacterium]
MKIKDLLSLEVGESVSVFNEPFEYVGHAQIELDGGQKMRWMYGEDDRMLSVTPSDDELMLFEQIEDDLEPEDEMILYLGKEYEFSYEDAGSVVGIEGDSVTEEEDRFMFADYEAAGGLIVRLISNENTGESSVYFGRMVSEDDLAAL